MNKIIIKNLSPINLSKLPERNAQENGEKLKYIFFFKIEKKFNSMLKCDDYYYYDDYLLIDY